MDLLAFILAISAEGITDEQVQTALNAYIAEHPEAVTTVTDGSITKAKLDNNLKETVDDVGVLKSALEPTATSADVGKVMMVKTVENGKVTAWELAEVSGTAFPNASGVNF